MHVHAMRACGGSTWTGRGYGSAPTKGETWIGQRTAVRGKEGVEGKEGDGACLLVSRGDSEASRGFYRRRGRARSWRRGGGWRRLAPSPGRWVGGLAGGFSEERPPWCARRRERLLWLSGSARQSRAGSTGPSRARYEGEGREGGSGEAALGRVLVWQGRRRLRRCWLGWRGAGSGGRGARSSGAWHAARVRWKRGRRGRLDGGMGRKAGKAGPWRGKEKRGRPSKVMAFLFSCFFWFPNKT